MEGLPTLEWRYSIADLAREFGITPRTLRFYEERGLLSPGRKKGMRSYSRRDRARLQLILQGRRFGLSVSEIGALLKLYRKGDNSEQLLAALARFRSQIDLLRGEQKAIDDNIARLRQACLRMEAAPGVNAASRTEAVTPLKRRDAKLPPGASAQATAFRTFTVPDARRAS